MVVWLCGRGCVSDFFCDCVFGWVWLCFCGCVFVFCWWCGCVLRWCCGVFVVVFLWLCFAVVLLWREALEKRVVDKRWRRVLEESVEKTVVEKCWRRE